jgi:hypothetical protein
MPKSRDFMIIIVRISELKKKHRKFSMPAEVKMYMV